MKWRVISFRLHVKVPSPQQVFLLMPFRHTQKTQPRLRRALEALDARQVWDCMGLAPTLIP